MTLPNFLIAGAIKSGTTSLYHYLMQHPSVCLSPDVKESRFLVGLTSQKNPEMVKTVNHITDFESYQMLFEHCSPEQVVGEVDPWCLYLYDQAIPRIKLFLDPSIKIVICLRNPIDRCYSHYYQVVKQGWKTQSFSNTIDAVISDKKATWYEQAFLNAGLYFEQVDAYLKAFPSEQIRIFLFDDLTRDGAITFKELCQFIGVNDNFSPDTSKRVNIGGVPKNRTFHNLLKTRIPFNNAIKNIIPAHVRKNIRQTLMAQNLRNYPQMNEIDRVKLTNFYREDILKLQSLLDKDLTSWLVSIS